MQVRTYAIYTSASDVPTDAVDVHLPIGANVFDATIDPGGSTIIVCEVDPTASTEIRQFRCVRPASDVPDGAVQVGSRIVYDSNSQMCMVYEVTGL